MPSLQPTQKEKGLVAGFTLLSRLKPFLDILLILGSAVQLGLHFWPASSFVYGVRIDYLSPTLFALDLGILLSLCISYCAPSGAHTAKWGYLKYLLILGLSNLIFSLVPLQSLVWWTRIILLYIWAQRLPRALVTRFISLFLGWLTFLFFLGLVQVLTGSSLQGAFYWLGERRLTLGQPALALQTILDNQYLRAYSVFSHPNIFAGYSIIFVALITNLSQSKMLRHLALLLGFLIVLITASRAATISYIFVLAINFAGRITPKYSKLLYLLPCILLLYLFVVRVESVLVPRLSLLSASLQTIVTYPTFGTGVLGSLAAYPVIAPALRLIQPDHFLPTLLFSWLGLVGITQLAIMFYHHKPKTYDLKVLLPLLPLIVFDHYLVTSLSGLAITILYLRFSTNS